MDENDLGNCLECEKTTYIGRDIQLCDDCINLFNLDSLWELHDTNKIDALDFNESETVRERFRYALIKYKNTDTNEYDIIEKKPINMAKYFICDIINPSGLGLNTTEMIYFAKQKLAENKKIGIDTELKSKDLNDKVNAWIYLLHIGMGVKKEVD